MANRALAPLVQLLRQFRLQRGGTTTDAELLQLFISQRDDDAFEALVRRHGPMVLGVCRRILHNEADVEDCFQATFLVLVRKAASLRRRCLVSNWLYGTARKAALNARAMRNLRHRKEKEAGAEKARKSVEHDRELQELLDQELESLPNKYRAAIILCDLEGLTIADAARQVGCPQGTLNARLVRGRAMLGKRLLRHGLAVSGTVLATALCQNAASACVPGPLVVSTVQAATLMAAGKTLAAGAISAKVVALTEGVLKAMLMTKLKVALAVVLAVHLIGAGVGLVYCQTAGSGQDKQGKPPVAQEKPSSPVPAVDQPTPKKDASDPLPAKPHAELQTVGFRGTSKVRGCSTDDWQSVVFSPDGKRMAFVKVKNLATAKPTYTFHLQEVSTGKDLWTVECQESGCVAFSPDGKLLARGENSVEDRVEHVDPATGVRTQTYTIRGTVHLHDAATGKELRTFKVQGQEKEMVDLRSLAFSPDGTALAAVELRSTWTPASWTNSTPSFHLWEVATGKELRQARGDKELRYVFAGFSPDGKTLAWEIKGTHDPGRLIDLNTGKALFSIAEENSSGYPRTVPFILGLSPDGKTCISGSYTFTRENRFNGPHDISIHLWDLARAKEIRRFETHHGGEVRLAFSADGRTLVSADNGIMLWDVATGQKLQVLGENPVISSVAFSPDGRSVVSGDMAGRVRLWEAATGKIRWEVPIPKPRDPSTRTGIHSVSFSPDGRMLDVVALNQDKSGAITYVTLLWSLAGERKDTPLSTKELETLWADLADTDGAQLTGPFCRWWLRRNKR